MCAYGAVIMCGFEVVMCHGLVLCVKNGLMHLFWGYF